MLIASSGSPVTISNITVPPVLNVRTHGEPHGPDDMTSHPGSGWCMDLDLACGHGTNACVWMQYKISVHEPSDGVVLQPNPMCEVGPHDGISLS